MDKLLLVELRHARPVVKVVLVSTTTTSRPLILLAHSLIALVNDATNLVLDVEVLANLRILHLLLQCLLEQLLQILVGLALCVHIHVLALQPLLQSQHRLLNESKKREVLDILLASVSLHGALVENVVKTSLQVGRINLGSKLVELTRGGFAPKLVSDAVQARGGRQDRRFAALVDVASKANYLQLVLSLKLLLSLTEVLEHFQSRSLARLLVGRLVFLFLGGNSVQFLFGIDSRI